MSTIEWTDHTINPLVGCTKVPGALTGCKNCYAEAASKTGRLQQFSQYHGVVNEHGHWTGKINFVPEQLEKLFKFRKPTRVFMPSMSDPFHPAVKEEWLDQIFAAIALNPQVTVQMLTKRPERMLEYIEKRSYSTLWKAISDLGNSSGIDPLDDKKFPIKNGVRPYQQWPLSNLHLGISVENQKAADDRIPLLLHTPAALRFLSVEPLLEAVDLIESGGMYNPGLGEGHTWLNPLSGIAYDSDGSFSHTPAIDWIIVGGESGPGARPCNINWIDSIIQQCQSSQVPVFVKQLGSNPVNLGCEDKLRDRKGGSIAEWPEHLRVREFPV